MTVWRAVQTITLVVDIGMLAAFTKALNAQGRMDVRAWRAEKWVNYPVTVGRAVIRSGFLLALAELGGRERRKCKDAFLKVR